MVDKNEVKRVFALSKQDIYFIIVIVMLGVQMAFNFSLVEPLRTIQERIEHDQKIEIAKVLDEIRAMRNSSSGEQTDEARPQLEEVLRSHNISTNG